VSLMLSASFRHWRGLFPDFFVFPLGGAGGGGARGAAPGRGGGVGGGGLGGGVGGGIEC
jgi:hypothetical protein